MATCPPCLLGEIKEALLEILDEKSMLYRKIKDIEVCKKVKATKGGGGRKRSAWQEFLGGSDGCLKDSKWDQMGIPLIGKDSMGRTRISECAKIYKANKKGGG